MYNKLYNLSDTCAEKLSAVDNEFMGAFTPACDDNGNFKPAQCHSSTGYCWCSTLIGDKIEGTEVRFDTPTCNSRMYSIKVIK